MEAKITTASDYAKRMGVSQQAVTKAMRNNRVLPYVDRYERIGKVYILHISKIIPKKERNNLVS